MTFNGLLDQFTYVETGNIGGRVNRGYAPTRVCSLCLGLSDIASFAVDFGEVKASICQNPRCSMFSNRLTCCPLYQGGFCRSSQPLAAIVVALYSREFRVTPLHCREYRAGEIESRG